MIGNKVVFLKCEVIRDPGINLHRILLMGLSTGKFNKIKKAFSQRDSAMINNEDLIN